MGSQNVFDHGIWQDLRICGTPVPQDLVQKPWNEEDLHLSDVCRDIGAHVIPSNLQADCYANGNQEEEEEVVVQHEVQEIKETIKLEQGFESNGWLELIKTKGNRHRLIILISGSVSPMVC